MNLELINKMYETINAMGVVLNEVASHRCLGRKEMNESWDELRVMMRELNKPPVVLTAEEVIRLRDHTGEGMMACKKALVASDGDFDKAVDYLRKMGTTHI